MIWEIVIAATLLAYAYFLGRRSERRRWVHAAHTAPRESVSLSVSEHYYVLPNDLYVRTFDFSGKAIPDTKIQWAMPKVVRSLFEARARMTWCDPTSAELVTLRNLADNLEAALQHSGMMPVLSDEERRAMSGGRADV